MCLYPIYLGSEKRYRNCDITDKEFNRYIRFNDDRIVPCGKCIECLKEYSTVWAYRCCLEASLYKENCFVTLTYEETDGNLHRRDIQLFVKRLRKSLNCKKVRYFYCGEYGSKGRPHYHIILFGYCPKDLVKFGNYYVSPTIDNLWSKSSTWYGLNRKGGFHSIGVDLNEHTAKYCAKYMQKFLSISEELNPSFVGMSTRPGIGLSAVNSSCLKDDKIYLNGNYIKVPRYYLKKLSEYYPKEVLALKEKRKENMDKFINDSLNVDTIRKKRENEKNFILGR